jgi:type IV pilus assembly protein PilW
MMNNRFKNTQHGMSLIEIMIALLLGAFLLGGVIKIFIGSKQNYRMQENLSRIQESGRFSLEFLSRDIRMADFRVCISPPPLIAAAADAASAAAVAGVDNATVAAAPFIAGTDSITITQQTNICTAGAVTTSTITYSIQADASGQPALFKSDSTILGGAAQAQIEGVEDMQILYGEDTDADGTPNYYVPFGTVGLTMSQVVSARISLLTRSLDDRLTSQPIAFTYNNATTTPADRRLRRVFSTTVSLRNRL